MTGPKAPKDPVSKKQNFYIMFEKEIEATRRDSGVCSQEIYLNDGRLISMAKIAGCVQDEQILSLLKTAEGFRKLVDSIGISVTAKDHQETIWASFQVYGKEDVYGGGTRIRVPILANGAEEILHLNEIVWSDDDNIPGNLTFEFEKEGELASATVKLYLNDGYEAPKAQAEKPAVLKGIYYEKMIAKSLLYRGDGARVRNVIEKAKQGKEVVIACIGGSITQGAGAKPIHKNCYAHQFYEWFQNTYGNQDKEQIKFIKAGVGGTPSELGMIRYNRDVLREGVVKPDLVVIEFAVNDEGDETKGECYESLIREILSQGNEPAILLLFAVFADDYNLQERFIPIGEHYHLPMVSVKNAVVEQFYAQKGRVISKNQYFYDCYHPTNSGHKIMADSLRFCIQKEEESQNQIPEGAKREEWQKESLESQRNFLNSILAERPVMPEVFEHIQMFDRSNVSSYTTIQSGSEWPSDLELQCVEMDANPYQTPEFPHNWMHTPSCTEHSFIFSVKSQALFLVYKDSGDNAFGTAEIFVDGKHIRTADPHVNGWTHCNPILLYRNQEESVHNIEVRVEPQKKFTILAFAVTEIV